MIGTLNHAHPTLSRLSGLPHPLPKATTVSLLSPSVCKISARNMKRTTDLFDSWSFGNARKYRSEEKEKKISIDKQKSGLLPRDLQTCTASAPKRAQLTTVPMN
jgi:hypothetical protein